VSGTKNASVGVKMADRRREVGQLVVTYLL